MQPISGKKVYNALRDKDLIILACNPRVIPGVAKGIFRAAKEMDAVIIMELARSECNTEGGYTGLTPQTLFQKLTEVNNEVGHDIWVLHADHLGIKKGTLEEMEETKELINNQIKAGYTSFAIDASHLFNFEGKTVAEQLKPNIDATIELGKHIIKQVGNDDFGLEVEVGEIGWKNNDGMILTKPEEAVVFIKALKDAGLNPDLIAISNGSSHGNVYDQDGNVIPIVTIDIKRTQEIAQALKKNGFDVKIAQHGITGTPIELIKDKFPKGDILKGNVATLFQNIVFECLQKHHPDLHKEIYNWVLENKPMEGKKPQEVFGKNVKFAIIEFFDRINDMGEDCKKEVEQRSYEEVKNFIDAFNSKGTAAIIREVIYK